MVDSPGAFQRLGRGSLANSGSVADNRIGILLVVVLAAAAVARVSSGNSRRSTLAIAGGASVGAGIRGCPALGLDFGWTGRGTPAPVTPPQRLVVVGFYRNVHNPMYLGFATGWIGLWVVFGHANPLAIVAVAAVAIAVHLFVVFYEEPTLRKKFGADYVDYRRNVDRWRPRVRG